MALRPGGAGQASGAAVADKMKPNPGRQPDETKGKRVFVRLANGKEPSREPVTTVTPAGWAADTANWRITPGYPFSISHYEVIK